MTLLFLGSLGLSEILIMLLIPVVLIFIIVLLARKSTSRQIPVSNQGKEDISSLRSNKLIPAFSLLMLCTLIHYLPVSSRLLTIVQIYADIFTVIAVGYLIKHLKGSGRAGAIILLTVIILNVTSTPFQSFRDIVSSILSPFQSMKSMLDLDLMPMDDSHLQSFNTFGSWLNLSSLIQSALSVCVFILWLCNSQFRQMKTGVIILLSVHLLWFLDGVLDLSLSSIGWILGIIAVTGYFAMLSKISLTDTGVNRRTRAFLLCATGFIYSILILVDNGYPFIITSMVGAVIWLIGVSIIRANANSRKGLGAFTAYGILTIISSLLNMIPALGGIFAFIIQIPAFIILAVGFFRFHSNPVFYNNGMCGMHTLGNVSIFSLIAAILFIIPVVGETLSALLLCLLLFPMILWSWRNALNAQGMERYKGDVKILDGMPVMKDEAPVLQNVKPVLQNEISAINEMKPTDHSRFMPPASNPVPRASQQSPEPMKKQCPYCGEEVLAVAIKCKHCNEWFDSQ